ncbi:uncharacterized protein A4U43_C07F31460 [Asparagus officinalis]|uniref:Methyltransferase n=1 Tax=Asparagus officinalis TaxID=4686 RepID=A0A5P1EG90_ASPOF|nr:uncharacterized protein A4U43_C07F31460 [Asparagus officinalis]
MLRLGDSNRSKNKTEALVKKEEEREEEVVESEEGDNDPDIEDGVEVNPEVNAEDEDGEEQKRRRKKKKKGKILGPLFDPSAVYDWKLCAGSNNPRPVGCRCRREYRTPVVPWPESQFKVDIFYRNVAHPKLSAYVKTRRWVNVTGEYLMFPQDESEFKGGVHHYLGSIEEMVPDIEWGKNIRVVLDIGCADANFAAALLEKDVITLSLGLIHDRTDLAQVALERGIPAVLGSLETKRLPFPSSVFDAIHCSDCNTAWHSTGGKLLLEMNRILRPGGYFIMSTSHGDVDREEGMSELTASICWNILAHKTDDVSEMSAKIYQKPTSNDIYELRRRNQPPLCKENENQDAAWYTPIKTCLHKVPSAIEQRGTDWPEEWPKRLETFPEWLGDSQDKLHADDQHWKAIFNRSYFGGLGIDWLNIRNVMDMKAIYGGFAAALTSQKVWVMNVVPVHAPNTLPIIYERGLLGIYHDWCEPFSTYPRTFDLLHADHLFSRLKNR